MFNSTLKMGKTLLFFLIVVINGQIYVGVNIGLDTCTTERWKDEVSRSGYSLLLTWMEKYYHIKRPNSSSQCFKNKI